MISSRQARLLPALAVETAKDTAVVCSDLTHIARNFKEDWPSALIADLPGWMVSFDKVRAKASAIDLLFPRHDKVMLLDYPKAA